MGDLLMSTDDPWKAAELREALQRRARLDRQWQRSAFADWSEPSRRQAPEQTYSEYAAALDARIKAEIAARDAADLKAAKIAAELALTLPPPKPFTS